MEISDIFEINPYSLNKIQKQELLNYNLNLLFRHHYDNCIPFKKMMDANNYEYFREYNYQDLPYLPVRLFKDFDLKSISDEEVIKTLTSSGTSGQAVSKIYLDKEAASMQTKTLTKIVSSFIGKKRVPMIIIDSESVVKDRNLFSARGAGILGFSIFGHKRIFALNNQMELNINELKEFLEIHKGEKIFIFGFTFMVYKHFYKELEKLNIELDLSNALLIHGGGWKKLINEALTPEFFKEKLNKVCKLNQIYDYYGMVEQTGGIFMECEKGYLHAPVFSDIIIRRAADFSIADIGEKGIIQVVSILPRSYPGQSLLTEDEGMLIGEDTCKCGRLGKYFKIIGRLKMAEVRGCSDTYGASL